MKRLLNGTGVRKERFMEEIVALRRDPKAPARHSPERLSFMKPTASTPLIDIVV